MYGMESESCQDIIDSDPNLEVLVFSQRENVLLYRVSSAALVKLLCNIPFNFDADFSDVGNWLF